MVQTKSIQLSNLDSKLLAEVKDMLIPSDRMVTYSDHIIGKGVELGLDRDEDRMCGSGDTWNSPDLGNAC